MNIYPVYKSVNKPNKWLVKSKRTICSTLIGSAIFLAASAHASQQNLDEMHKQLSIMNNIIQSAIKSEPTHRGSKISALSSIYLQGQGVVFTLTSRHTSSFSRHFVMPTAPDAPIAIDGDFAVNVHNELDDIVIDFESSEDEYEHVIEVFEQQREHSRELRSEQRELAYQLRDIARESKDAQYQLRHVEEKEKKQLKAELEKLESKRVSVEKSKALLDKKAKKVQQQRVEQQAIKAKQRAQYFDKLSNTVVDTLCTYGNGLKAIPKDEHVSLIVKAAGEETKNRYQDRVIVFTKKDINDCANDKINSKKLLAKAAKYQF